MIVVIDSNVFVSCLNSSSPYHKIFEALIKGQYKIVVSTDIVFEYREVFLSKFNEGKSLLFLGVLQTLKNVIEAEVFFKWNLITIDPDDNKFVDCAIAGNADYIVTNDKHCKILKEISFPKVECITLDEFMIMLERPDKF